MAEQDQTLRKIDWKSVFPFVHLFRGFRLAIDPSKLLLALAALLLLYTGGRLLDGLWPTHSRAMPQEISRHESSTGDFHATRKAAAQERYDDLKRALAFAGKPADGDVDDLNYVAKVNRDNVIKTLEEDFDKLPADQQTEEARKTRDTRIERAYAEYGTAVRRFEPLEGEGLFIHFISYEINQVDAAAASAVGLDFGNVIVALQRFFIVGPKWAITQHYVFFTLFFAFYVLLMAIAGGAISRIAAVQVARDEKISVRQALRFSTGKVLSFVFAPVIPILIVVVIAVLLGLLSALMSVSYIGGLWSILVGVLFILAILAGLVMALTALGLIGGGHLMYPTIAVEGSDSFDAISRSFSYVYARPWRMLFFTAVSVVYGALTYLFVRLFIWVMLSVAHLFVGVGMFTQTSTGADTWQAMWPSPTGSERLTYAIDNAALGTGGDIGAFFIAFWVYLVVGVLGAFAISFYFSANTIIYFLMRNEVDATELDDVYIEQSDDDLLDRPLPNDLTKPVDSSKLVESTKPMESTVPTDSTRPIESSTPRVIDAGRSATSSDSSPSSDATKSSDASPSSIASIDLGTLDAPNPPTTPPTQP